LGDIDYEVSFSFAKSLELDKGEGGLKEVLAFVDSDFKQSLRECGMKQLGRMPVYFHKDDKSVYERLGLEVWQGYDITTRKSVDGVALQIETVNKFLRLETVLEFINNIKTKGDW
jgi:hypothetical protein